MKLNIRRLILVAMAIAIGASLQACGVKAPAEEGCNFVQNSEFQRVSWGGQVPVVLYVDSTVPSPYYDEIKAAAKQWNDEVKREVIKIGGWINTNGRPTQDGSNVIYYMSNWEENKSNEQARTTVYWSGDRIFESDIRINGRNFDFSWGDPIVGRVDMQSLMVHELGHVLGLAHSQTPQSVMAFSLPNATKRRVLSTADLASVRCEY